MQLMGSLQGRQVAALACFDSFGKTAMNLLRVARKEGASTSLHLLELPGRKLSRRQVLEIRRIDPRTAIKQHEWGQLRELRTDLVQVDALVLGLDGRRTRETQLLLQSAWIDQLRRPVLISAYPGILFRHQLEGMMDRSGVDLLCLNGETDAQLYRHACSALGLDSGNAVVTGLPILWSIEPRLQVPDAASIVFFEQPSVPDNPIQRKYICRRLADLAQAWPSHPVIFKPRTSKVEATLHRQHGEMASRIEKLSRRVPNLQISYKPSLTLLKKCGCAITVSSTAAMEAMALSVSTRIVSDLGVNETLGNHYFLESAAIADFDSIIRDPFSLRLDQAWPERHGHIPGGDQVFIAALASRLNNPPQSSESADREGPPGWGSNSWQTYALAKGGKKMLSSAGARSRLVASHRGRNLLRRARQRVVGLWGLERLFKGR
ncbi:hypothetical protein OGCDGJMD_00310 [Cyanobium usitatum str. Tous]|jgi:hypothetical protein|nr:hypothetical protein OGCDGJMD_00310 [Cyanobium usitatum str. Tous]